MPKTYTDLLAHLQAIASALPAIHSFANGNPANINSMPLPALPMLFVTENKQGHFIKTSDLLKGSNAEYINISILLLDAYPPSAQLSITAEQKSAMLETSLLTFIKLAFDPDYIADFKLAPTRDILITSGYSQYNSALFQVAADLQIRLN
jgi:hypothetical protein